MPQQDRIKTMTRTEAIADLRRVFLRLTNENSSMCKVAGDLEIFCHGFRRLSDAEFRERYGWLGSGEEEPRDVLEARANRWELVRQDFEEASLVCDIGVGIRGSCDGWNEFSNEQIASFYEDLFRVPVMVVSHANT